MGTSSGLDIVGKAIIVHAGADDFTSQPSGGRRADASVAARLSWSSSECSLRARTRLSPSRSRTAEAVHHHLPRGGHSRYLVVADANRDLVRFKITRRRRW